MPAYRLCPQLICHMRFLILRAYDIDDNYKPDVVYLDFYDETLAYTAALYISGDGSGKGASLSWDVNNDGRINLVDKELVQRFSRNFLVFGWHDGCQSKSYQLM